uniref:KIX_2 domain-containing protein n=1 Tax=Ascaris lumbricoides TaxID=6252 RepID=A0A0M3ILB2_ASCLU
MEDLAKDVRERCSCKVVITYHLEPISGNGHKIDEWDATSKTLTGSAKRLKALAITLSQVRATYDKLRNEYLKLYKEFKSTNTTRLPSKLISGGHSNIDSPLLHINKTRILGNLKALTRLTGMLSRMINVQKKNDSKTVKFQTSKITKTSVKNLSQGHKSEAHKSGDIEKKAAASINEVKQLMKQKEQHSKPHRNSFKSTRIYPERITNEDRYHGAISGDRRKESKTAMTIKKIESHSKNQERTKLGVHNAERPPIKVESATKTAEIPHQTQPPVDEISGKEIPRLIPDIEASDNGHIVATSEADGSALKPSSTKSDSSSNVNILTKKAQPIKGTEQSADNENSIEDLVENLKKEYKKINAPRAMPIPKSYIEDDEKEAMSSVTSMRPITQPSRPTLKLKEKTEHHVKPPVKVGKWNEGTSIRTAEACELVECDFEEDILVCVLINSEWYSLQVFMIT